MTQKRIQIGVGDERETAREFVAAWKRAERGEKIEPECRLHFESLEALLGTLTPFRWLLLKRLRKTGPVSIRTLSKTVGRDYENVHSNVKQLMTAGLITETDDGRVEVPWDVVEARLDLAA